MPIFEITEIDDPRLEVYRNLKPTNATREQNLFVVEGATVANRLLASDFQIESVLVTENKLNEMSTVVDGSTDLFVMSKPLVSQLVGFKFHLGILIAAHRKSSPRLEDVLPKNGPSLVLFGDHIIDQQNVGMMIRVASAFGADAVVFGPGSADAFSRRVTRISMGNGFFLPVVETNDASTTVEKLTSLNYSVAATVLAEDALELSAHRFTDRTAIVVGNETHGISEGVLEACTERLTISMLNDTDSVNVSIATGIFAHTYRSQMSMRHDNAET